MKKQRKVATKKSYSWRNFPRVFGVEHYPALAIPEQLSFVVNESALRKSKQYKSDPTYYDKLSRKYGSLLSKNHRAPAVIKFINDKVGHGLFAKKKIKKGELVGEYTGRLVWTKEADAENCYLFEYPGNYVNGKGKPIRFYVDAHLQGNEIRFINHSGTHPNVEVLEVPYQGRWYIAYVACEDISVGTQFLVDYGKFYWSDHKSKPAKLEP